MRSLPFNYWDRRWAASGDRGEQHNEKELHDGQMGMNLSDNNVNYCRLRNEIDNNGCYCWLLLLLYTGLFQYCVVVVFCTSVALI